VTEYLLYDNRTWMPGTGPDWKLKATTGRLASLEDVQAAFLDYCHATADQASLRNFDAALGGFAIHSASGYVLCVTLETNDHYGRPSWALVGFYFEQSAELLSALQQYDVISSARAIAAAQPSPATFVFRSIEPATEDAPTCTAAPLGNDGIAVFRGAESISNVIHLLLQACKRGLAPPSILGITALQSISGTVLARYSLVYCRDGGLASVLRERAAASVTAVAHPALPSMELAISEEGESELKPPRDGGEGLRERKAKRPMAALLVLFLVLAILASADSRRRALVPINFRTESATPQQQKGAPTGSIPQVVDRRLSLDRTPPDRGVTASSEEPRSAPARDLDGRAQMRLLARLNAIVRRFETLEPDELLSLSQTLSRCEDCTGRAGQKALNRALRNVAATRALVAGHIGDSVAYYTRDSGRSLPPAARLRGIRVVLDSWSRNQEDCSVLVSEFQSQEHLSLVRQWCDATEQLAALAEEEF
jgi:hypothetical protein